MRVREVNLQPKTVKPGYIAGCAQVEVRDTAIILKGIKFEFNAGELRVTLPPNIELGEWATRKITKAIAEELVDEIRLGLITPKS